MTNNLHFGVANSGPMYNIDPDIKILLDPLVRVPNSQTQRRGWIFSKEKLPDSNQYFGIMWIPDDYHVYEYKS